MIRTPKFRVHSKTKNGYCRACSSYHCYMTEYIPKNPQIWSWEKIYKHIQYGGTTECAQKEVII